MYERFVLHLQTACFKGYTGEYFIYGNTKKHRNKLASQMN